MNAMRFTGASVRRVEDPRLLTGAARFVADETPHGCLNAVFVRSPHARAAILAVDASAALALDGVVAVFTAAELSLTLTPVRQPALLAPDVPVLCRDTVRYVGDPVALVVATSRAIAEDAAELVEVEYEPMAAIVDMDDSLGDHDLLWPELGTNVLHHQHHRTADVDAALIDAAVVIRERFRQHRFANAPMECRGGVAEFDGERLTYTTGHQSPHDLKRRLAEVLELDPARVRVRCAEMGGSFGQKSMLSREDVATTWAAVQLGRPVRWIGERTENLLAGGHARDDRVDVEAGFAADGTLLAVRLHLVLSLGAYPQVGYPASGYANLIRSLFPAAYRIPAYEFTADLLATCTGTYIAFRGPWEMETFVRERLFDLAADRLGLDRIELRRRNLLTPDELAKGSCLGVVLDDVTSRETLETAAAEIEQRGWLDRRAAARAEGRCVGIGLACYVEPAPVSPSLLGAMGIVAAARTPQVARVQLDADGTVTLFTSQQPHGQGHETTLAQLTADRLDVPFERVRVVWGDTDLVPFNLVGTGGSRAATLASGAVIGAADRLAEALRDRAADALECSPDDLVLRDGTVSPVDAPSRAVSLAQLAADAPIEATGEYLSADGTWSNATHCCLVEVDAETGRTSILDYLVVEDCGPPINPAIVDGQIRGGVAQGISAVLFERVAYSPDGQPLTATFLDYLVPSAADLPHVEIHHLHSETTDPVPFRGVGEGGAIGAPSTVVSAISDAIGLPITEQHLPPAVVAAIIRRASDAQ